MKKNILITGGAGFVGSNLAIFLKKRLKDCQIICLDNLVRNGSHLNVKRLEDKGITFIKGDIRQKEELLQLSDIDCIVECSAEPSVLAAYTDPNYMIDTNLFGTVNCLELAKREKANFIFLSSSRVYPIDPINQIPYKEYSTRFDWNEQAKGEGFNFEGISENFPLAGVRSLYGTTKLSSEQIAQEYFDMFFLKGVINRVGVVAGPWQMGRIDQGIVGYWVAQHKLENQLKYIGYNGSGKQVRDVIHVDDLCKLILYQIKNIGKVNREIFNVGGGRKNSFSLLELTELAQTVTGKKVEITAVPEERKNDIIIYITDNARVQKQIPWEPQKSLEEIVTDINSWIDEHIQTLEPVFQQ